jgi:hypothetical protein
MIRGSLFEKEYFTIEQKDKTKELQEKKQKQQIEKKLKQKQIEE